MSPSLRRDDVALPWLVSVRWAGVFALGGAVAAGAQGLTGQLPLTFPLALVALSALSNLWLSVRLGRGLALSTTAAGLLTTTDVAVLSTVLHETGGVLNPVSIFYLVYIVLSALVLDRRWAWAVTVVAIAGYGILFLFPPAELSAAGAMHPEIALHVRGMWLAFATTSLLVALLVSRLVTLIDRRDRDIAELRERSARDTRLAALSTLAAGAAHELSTPLGTIAVAARELELALEGGPVSDEVRSDIGLIRGEVDRCRRLLHDMAGRLSGPRGEAAEPTSLAAFLAGVAGRLTPSERERLSIAVPVDIRVVWPTDVVTRAVVNIVRNGLQASPNGARVLLTAVADPEEQDVVVTVEDNGIGMTSDALARAGEPFFTTKPQGEGTGLGLFVARSTVEQLGGSLALTSEQGTGTTATIRLPADVMTTVNAGAERSNR
jgi:two-component system sensor histidine kinase RegB